MDKQYRKKVIRTLGFRSTALICFLALASPELLAFQTGAGPLAPRMKYKPDGEPRFVPEGSVGELTPGCSDRWRPGEPVNGIAGWVSDIAADSSGNVYAGGGFHAAGSTFVNNIAKWDGESWSALASGVDYEVSDIEVSGTDIYVGGYRPSATGSVSKWDGTTWTTLGSELDFRVYDIAVSGTNVYAAGGKVNLETQSREGFVSVWNGSNWTMLGSGINDEVYQIEVSGADVYAGGLNITSVGELPVNQIIKWNGTSWSDIGAGFGTFLTDLEVSGTDVYASGRLSTSPNTSAGFVAKWNGSGWNWISPLLTGSGFATVRGIEISGSELYAFGTFTLAGGIPAINIAKWNGLEWSALGPGVNEPVASIAISGADAYIVLDRFHLALSDNFRKWNGSNWSPVGVVDVPVSGRPSKFAVSGADVYAVGYFTTDGGVSSSQVAKWNGSGWAPLGALPNGPNGSVARLESIAASDTDVYVAGVWSNSPSPDTGLVLKWNGSMWSQLGTFSAPSAVTAITVSGPNIYVSRWAGPSPRSERTVAKWNGSDWVTLGGLTGRIGELVAYGSDLYAGGRFFNGQHLYNIAKWNGKSWSALGDGPFDPSLARAPANGFLGVTNIAVSGSSVYAAGSWDLSDYEDIGFVSKWNGTTWTELGTAYRTSTTDPIYALVASGSEVYFGGELWAIGGVSANNIAKWNGSEWSALGNGVNSIVTAMAIAGRELFVAGYFTTAGCHVSANFARYALDATKFDYDGDGRSDVSVFRPSTNEWHIMQSGGGIRVQGWGLAGDKMAPADFDGDGKTDVTVFRPSEGNWYVFNSSDNTVTVAGWGNSTDQLVPGDYNGDGKVDFAVFRESEGRWYRRDSDGQFHIHDWGLPGDIPAPADFDGDGRTDLTVFRPSEGRWYTIRSLDNVITTADWGINGDKPVAADYSGDGRADFVVYRPSDNTWYRRHTDDNSLHFITWGRPGDLPAPADFDGDGKTDLTVYRPSEGNWYIFGSTAGIYTHYFGHGNDLPTPNAFVY